MHKANRGVEKQPCPCVHLHKLTSGWVPCATVPHMRPLPHTCTAVSLPTSSYASRERPYLRVCGPAVAAPKREVVGALGPLHPDHLNGRQLHAGLRTRTNDILTHTFTHALMHTAAVCVQSLQLQPGCNPHRRVEHWRDDGSGRGQGSPGSNFTQQ